MRLNQTDAIPERLAAMDKNLTAGDKPLDPGFLRTKLDALLDEPRPILDPDGPATNTPSKLPGRRRQAGATRRYRRLWGSSGRPSDVPDVPGSRTLSLTGRGARIGTTPGRRGRARQRLADSGSARGTLRHLLGPMVRGLQCGPARVRSLSRLCCQRAFLLRAVRRNRASKLLVPAAPLAFGV